MYDTTEVKRVPFGENSAGNEFYHQFVTIAAGRYRKSGSVKKVKQDGRIRRRRRRWQALNRNQEPRRI